MSSSVLKNSTLGEFPKEAVFQHLFMEGLALYTRPDCSICPELSKVFPSSANLDTKQQIAGEIDFFVNGNLRWGIELLVNGGGVGEHLDRFSPPDGKYVPLSVNDYAIVDFRCSATNIVKTHAEYLYFSRMATSQLRYAYLDRIQNRLRSILRIEC